MVSTEQDKLGGVIVVGKDIYIYGVVGGCVDVDGDVGSGGRWWKRGSVEAWKRGR